jgi:TP53 regulating kinase-like protein
MRCRLPELDQKLLKQRLLQEVRCIVRCRRSGIRTTDIYFVDMHNCRLYLEYVQGCSAKQFFLSTGTTPAALLLSSTITGCSRDERHIGLGVVCGLWDDTDDVEAKLSIARQIGVGIAKMHDASITHGDLTTSNMMVNENMQVVCCSEFVCGKRQQVWNKPGK